MHVVDIAGDNFNKSTDPVNPDRCAVNSALGDPHSKMAPELATKRFSTNPHTYYNHYQMNIQILVWLGRASHS